MRRSYVPLRMPVSDHKLAKPQTIGDVLNHAAREAADCWNSELQPGHLLIIIYTLPSSAANVVLRDFIGRDFESLREVVGSQYSRDDRKPDNPVSASSAATISVLVEAERISQKNSDHVAIQPLDNLLFALLTDPGVVDILFDLSVSRDDVFRRLEHEVATGQ